MKQCSEKCLLIDNSNTRTKFVIASEGSMQDEPVIIPTAELSVEKIREVIYPLNFARVVVASVVPECEGIFTSAFACPVHFVSVQSPSVLVYDYEGVATLGADRIANAIAAASRVDLPCIAIDAGTATTFDVVVKRGGQKVYIGGAIAPGYAAFSKYLHHCTAKLPEILLSSDAAPIGKNTVQAMQAGSVHGFCGMVRGIISAIETQLGSPVHVVLTGGDASLLKTVGKIRGDVVPQLTFDGLLHVLHRL